MFSARRDDTQHQAGLYVFFQAPEAIDIGSVLDHPDTLRGHNLREHLAIVLAYANHCPHSAQRVAGDGLEVHLFEGPCPLGMKETAMGAYHQRDAMQQTQQAQIIDKEIDGMDVHQVVTADRPATQLAPQDSGEDPSGACGAP